MNDINFIAIDHHNKRSKNGIWLRYSSTTKNNNQEDFYLLIEMYERHLDSESSNEDQLVEFCGGKCGQKRKNVINLQDEEIEVFLNYKFTYQ